MGAGIQWDPSLEIYLIKILYLIGIRMENRKEREEKDEVIKRSRKAMHLIELTKMNKELVLTAREVGEHFGRSAVT